MLVLFGCAPISSQNSTDENGIVQGKSYALDGMVPIADIIPNWENVRARPGNLFLGADGKELQPYYAPNRFKCGNIDGAQYDMMEENSIYVPQVTSSTGNEKERLPLPPKLEKKLAKLRDKTLIKANVHDQEIRSLGLGYPATDFLRLRGGWLVSFAWGEFGGSLIWLRDIGGYHVVSHSNTNDILLHKGTVYAGVGGSHFGYHNPAVLKIRKTLFGFNVETVKTPRPVLALKVHNNNILGLMGHSLLRLTQEDGATQVLTGLSDGQGVRLERFGLLPDGHAYAAGENFIGIYDDPAKNLIPKLYIPEACSPVFAQVRAPQKF